MPNDLQPDEHRIPIPKAGITVVIKVVRVELTGRMEVAKEEDEITKEILEKLLPVRDPRVPLEDALSRALVKVGGMARGETNRGEFSKTSAETGKMTGGNTDRGMTGGTSDRGGFSGF